METKNTLDQWACSFAGCDGRSLDSDAWLCGTIPFGQLEKRYIA